MRGKTVTRAKLVDAVRKETGMSRSKSAEFLEEMLGIITRTLVKGEPVKLIRFGGMTVREKNPRMGRNPKTGEEAIITARRVISFRASPIMRARVQRAHQNK